MVTFKKRGYYSDMKTKEISMAWFMSEEEHALLAFLGDFLKFCGKFMDQRYDKFPKVDYALL